MPLYDFECGRGHVFEKVVPYEDRNKPIPCEHEIEVREISLEQLADSLEQSAAATLQSATSVEVSGPPVPGENATLVPANGEAREGEPLAMAPAVELGSNLPVTKMACGVRARYILTHGHPGGLLDHGLAANRDAALEGRWDPDRPITRGVRK